jgi:hypothetical protein
MHVIIHEMLEPCQATRNGYEQMTGSKKAKITAAGSGIMVDVHGAEDLPLRDRIPGSFNLDGSGFLHDLLCMSALMLSPP